LPPQRRRAEALAKRLAGARAEAADLQAAAEALRSRRGAERHLQARLDAKLDSAHTQVRRLEAELDRLTPADEQASSSSPEADRLQLALVEERIEQLARRAVARERLQPSAGLLATLGERPQDPARAALWNEGVHAIHAYRHRHGVQIAAGNSLGTAPADPRQNREWRQAERTVKRVQAALGLERALSAERTLA
jgi:hypothetical protein